MLSRCPGVEHVADVRSYIEGKFVIIVGDRELAEELGVGHATVAKTICLTDSKHILKAPRGTLAYS